jgi:LysM repeat protein
MKPIFILSLFLVQAFAAFAQQQKNPATPPKTVEKKPTNTVPDSVFVVVAGESKYLQHKVKKGETVYSIKKFYNIELSQLYHSNPDIEKKGLTENKWITIPLAAKAVQRQKSKGFVDSAFVKVYYRVKEKETLYRISKVYFNISVELMQERNKLKTTSVSTGQLLHIGWLPKSGVPDSLSKQVWLTGVLAEENTKLKKKYEAEMAKGKKENMQEGKACWPKHQQMEEANSLYILHSEAKEGSIVRIENPMTQRTLYAKVIGPVPDTPFARGSIAMLSTTVANALGVLDSMTFLKIQYLK